ncbi:MAG: Ig-like domain-containing protein, partial [Candidatus Hadarchaeales archaeon]
VDNDENFSHPRRYENLYETSFTIPDELEDGTYYWRVKAIDLSGTGNAGPWSDVVFFTVDTVPPPAPSLISPGNGTLTNDNTPTFEWNTVIDPSGIRYYELNYARDPTFTENLQIVLCDPFYNPPYTLPSDKALPDGTWYWRVRASDDAGNWGEWSEVWTFTVDTSPPPVPSLLLPTNGSILDTPTPTFRWTSVTDPSGVTYRLVVDNDPDFSSPIYDNSSITENSLTLPPENALPDGTYYWRVRARDNAGNQAWSGSWSFTVDTSPPGKPLPLSPENGSYINDNTPLLRWTRVVDPSGVLYDLELDDNDTFSSPLLSCYGLPENELELENALPDGTYYWRVRARDGWGREGEWSVAFFTVDTRPPVEPPLLISPQPGENTRDNTPTFRWSHVTDAARYEIWIDNDNDFSSPMIMENTPTFIYTPSIPLVDGIYYWRVRPIDAAGNPGISWSDIWWFRVDNTVTAPALILPAEGAYENDNRPTFSWSTVMDPSSPVTYRLQISYNSTFTDIIYDKSNIAENSIKIENELPENSYYWRVQARDNLGNENWSESRKLTIDMRPPSSSVRPLSPYWRNTVPFTIEAENTPDLSGVESIELWYRYSDDNWSWGPWTKFGIKTTPPWSWEFTAPCGDGFYQFYSVARDRAGNVEPTPGEADSTCGVDTTPPIAPTLISPENDNHSRDNTPHFDWLPVPDLSGATYILWIDNKPDFSTTRKYSDLPYSEFTIPDEESLPENRYYWRVRAVDQAGNLGEWSESREFVVDITPPSKPVLRAPENDSPFENLTITFRWDEIIDEWAPGFENYLIQMAADSNFTLIENENTLSDNFYIYTFASENTYYWRVQAFDKAGNPSGWSDTFVIRSQVRAPRLCSPENFSIVADNRPTFRWYTVI